MNEQSQDGMAAIIDGRKVASEIHESVRLQVDILKEKGQRPPKLTIVLVGEDPGSQIYVRNKSRVCKKVGIEFEDLRLPVTTPLETLLGHVNALNRDPNVDGILVQLPLPEPLRPFEPLVMQTINPDKDVDGFHPDNVGRLLLGRPRFVACTPLGILELLDRTGVALEGARAVVVGRSVTVGRPIAALLLGRNATVIQCHSRTRDLAQEVARADILVVAAGRANLIRGDWIKPGAVVIDVGMNRLETGLTGDVAFEEARQKASFITPVPGGVGPMTIAMLTRNVLQARLPHSTEGGEGPL